MVVELATLTRSEYISVTFRLCQLCYPEVSCDFCEPEQETENESEGPEMIEESVASGSNDSYNWKSLQSLSELAIEEPELEKARR